nr:PREDICTED: uncharacterized protein C16orf46 homolog [Latimeria chalumnae]|eukprot:XP_006004921.2 PREDICTED: uncharacterized protein C16orf46 homolog [Latimeria chalumnae]
MEKLTDRNLVNTLLDISEENSEQDNSSINYVIHTGWEEAVQSWGRASPFACLQLQKKPKKVRSAETVSHCRLCLDAVQLSEKNTSGDTARHSKSNCRSSAVNDKVSGKNVPPLSEGSLSSFAFCNMSNYNYVTVPKRETTYDRVNTAELLQRELTLANEQDTGCQNNSRNADIVLGKLKHDPKKQTCEKLQSHPDALAFSFFSVLPPVKPGNPIKLIGNSARKHSSVRGGTPSGQDEGNLSSMTVTGSPCHNLVSKKSELKEEESTVFDAHKQLIVQDTMFSVVPLIPKISAFQSTEYCNWPYSFMSEKSSSAVVSDPGTRQIETTALVKRIQGRKIPNSKRNLKQNELGRVFISTCNQNSKMSGEAKEECVGRYMPVLSQQVSSILSVTRVAVSVLPYRPL